MKIVIRQVTGSENIYHELEWPAGWRVPTIGEYVMFGDALQMRVEVVHWWYEDRVNDAPGTEPHVELIVYGK